MNHISVMDEKPKRVPLNKAALAAKFGGARASSGDDDVLVVAAPKKPTPRMTDDADEISIAVPKKPQAHMDDDVLVSAPPRRPPVAAPPVAVEIEIEDEEEIEVEVAVAAPTNMPLSPPLPGKGRANPWDDPAAYPPGHGT